MISVQHRVCLLWRQIFCFKRSAVNALRNGNFGFNSKFVFYKERMSLGTVSVPARIQSQRIYKVEEHRVRVIGFDIALLYASLAPHIERISRNFTKQATVLLNNYLKSLIY